MLTVKVTFILRKPTRRGVIKPRAVQCLCLPVHGVALKLPPALIENRICNDAGMIVQMQNGIFHMLCKEIPALPSVPGFFVLFPAESQGGKRRVPDPGIEAVIYHILHHQHTVKVTVIIKAFRFNLDMLPKQIHAKGLHSQHVLFIFRFLCRKVDAVAKISLIQDPLQKYRLPVETDPGYAVRFFHFNGSESKIGTNGVLSHCDSHLIEPWIRNIPE